MKMNTIIIKINMIIIDCVAIPIYTGFWRSPARRRPGRRPSDQRASL